MPKHFFFLLAALFTCHFTISCKVSDPAKVTGSWNPGDKLLPIEYRDRWGFINQKGQVVIAPKFRDVGAFSEDLCPARLNGTYGFITPGGEFAIPAIYDYALPFSEGQAQVYINGEVSFIDKYGNIQIPKPSEALTSSEELSIDAHPTQSNRAFIGEIRDWVLVDRSGKQLSNNHFVWIKQEDFTQNLVLVAAYPATKIGGKGPLDMIPRPIHHIFSLLRGDFQFTPEEKWGAIDSMGEYIFPPIFDKVLEPGFQPEGLLVAIADTVLRSKNIDVYTGHSYHWGLVDLKGNYLVKPKFTMVSDSGFQNGLLYAEIDSLYGYADISGNFVWSAVKSIKTTKPQPLNSAFMLPGYLLVFPSDFKWGMNNKYNLALPIPPDFSLPKDTFGVHVFSNFADTFQQKWQGKRTVVFNTSKDTLNVDVQDNRLYAVIQAIDPTSGEWRDIEYFSNSWCGMSYYTVPLKPNEYWNLVIPEYEGDISTKLRLAFTWRSQWQENGSTLTKTVYSNTFSGSINPGQFWNKSDPWLLE